MPPTSDQEDPFAGSRMTLGEHLEELRSRLIKSTIALVVAFAVAWTYHERLGEVIFEPYERATVWLEASLLEKLTVDVESGAEPWQEVFTTNDPATRELLGKWQIHERPKGDAASTGVFFYIRICVYFALFFSGPYLLWHLWQFVAAGLYDHEKNTFIRYFPVSGLLFLAGAVFGYLVLVPYALFFLADFSIKDIEYYESINTYLSFMTSLTIALGAVFQMPLIMVALARLGIVHPRQYARYRPHCIVGSLIVAALLTPPDPFTQMMMAGPMVVLYEIGHLASRLAYKERSEPEPDPPAEGPAADGPAAS